MPSNSLHGFCSDLQDVFFQLQPGCHLQIALVSRQRIEHLALVSHEHRALELISTTNSACLPSERLERFARLLQTRRLDPLQGELIEAEVLDLLGQRELKRISNGELSHRSDLMQQLIRW